MTPMKKFFLLTFYRVRVWEEEDESSKETDKQEIDQKVQIVQEPAKLPQLVLQQDLDQRVLQQTCVCTLHLITISANFDVTLEII